MHLMTDRHKIKKSQFAKRKSIFAPLTNEEYELINSFQDRVDEALRLGAKQKKETFKAIRELFEELTSERESKHTDYLSNPSKLSAYIYYYLWWNLLRFVRLFNGLSLNIREGDVIGDFGCGPFSFVLALWIAKPELRDKQLTFYCVDISDKAMKAGEEIFNAFISSTTMQDETRCTDGEKTDMSSTVNRESNWRIKRVVAPFGIPLKEKLDFFFSANMFNEICWKNIKNLKIYGEKQASIVDSYLKDSASVLIIEPGLPTGGKIVSVFRKFFVNRRGYSVIAPCPHINLCPLHERESMEESLPMSKLPRSHARGKWCHFSFSTLTAPKRLAELSAKVHLAKKTASLSFLYCCKGESRQVEKSSKSEIEVIVTSDIIKLHDESFGVYACSVLGFLLLTAKNFARLKLLKSGTYLKIDTKKIGTLHDRKSGAIIVELF